MYQRLNAQEFEELFTKNQDALEIIDVREEYEFNEIRIKKAKIIPMDEIPNRLAEINWEKQVILACRSGSRSGYIAQYLDNMGKQVFNLEGGIALLAQVAPDCLEK
ncbi:MAG: rhodanese-like domain-containing protein [Candidatus Moraniibacteriota bacterium]